MYDNLNFAKIYDHLYSNKDYKGEVQIICKNFKNTKKHKLLDVGCGTGLHAKEFAALGHHVTGIDISEAMINIAKKHSNENLTFIVQRIFDQHEKKYDCITMLFNVINHIENLKCLRKTIKKSYDLLENGGFFIFDCHNSWQCIIEEPFEKETRKIQSKVGIIDVQIHSKNDMKNLISNVFMEIKLNNEQINVNYSNVYWPQKIIYDLLKEIGFKEIKISDKNKRTIQFVAVK